MPVRNPVILLDVDGVLADFVSGFLSVANKLVGTHYKPEDVKEYSMTNLPGLKAKSYEIWSQCQQEGFALKLPVFKGAVEAVQMLQRLGEVFVVTAPCWSPRVEDLQDLPDGVLSDVEYLREGIYDQGRTWSFDRARWLSKHFGIEPDQVISTHAKHVIEGNVLIDDSPEKILSWATRHPRRLGILFTQPYNENSLSTMPRNVVRTSNWDTIENLIVEHLEK